MIPPKIGNNASKLNANNRNPEKSPKDIAYKNFSNIL